VYMASSTVLAIIEDSVPNKEDLQAQLSHPWFHKHTKGQQAMSITQAASEFSFSSNYCDSHNL
jgi:hypothetical protein